MKTLLRSFLTNLGALWVTSQVLPALVLRDGIKGLVMGSLAFMLANILLIPIIKVMLLPLNLLTLGIFAWLSNVMALYFLVTVLPSFNLLPYNFSGLAFSGFVIPQMHLSVFQTAIVVSFIIGFIIHFIGWLVK